MALALFGTFLYSIMDTHVVTHKSCILDNVMILVSSIVLSVGCQPQKQTRSDCGSGPIDALSSLDKSNLGGWQGCPRLSPRNTRESLPCERFRNAFSNDSSLPALTLTACRRKVIVTMVIRVGSHSHLFVFHLVDHLFISIVTHTATQSS